MCFDRLDAEPNVTRVKAVARLLDLYGHFTAPDVPSSGQEDDEAVKILEMFHPVVLDRRCPRIVVTTTYTRAQL